MLWWIDAVAAGARLRTGVSARPISAVTYVNDTVIDNSRCFI